MNSTSEVSGSGWGMSGKRVKTITLRAQLRPEKQAAVDEGQYFFCGSIECETVYFTEEGERTFFCSEEHLAGWQDKNPELTNGETYTIHKASGNPVILSRDLKP